MKYEITNFTTAVDLALAEEAEIGVESNVEYSYEPWGYLGLVTFTAAGTAVLSDTPSTVEEAAIFAAPRDIVLVAKNGVRSSAGAITVTLDVKDEITVDATAAGTLAAPPAARDTTHNFGIGAAMDMSVAAGTVKKVTKVVGIDSVTNGAVGNKFEIWALPNTWIDLRCPTSKDITFPIPETVAIACGRNSSRFVKQGPSAVSNLAISAKHTNHRDGLGRILGQKVSARVTILRDDRLLVEQLIFDGWRPSVQTPRGEGADEVVDTAEGAFQHFAIFS
jgi:hypothetical protein